MLNYGNRNATSLYTTKDIIKSYTIAASASIVVALGIRKILEGQTKHMRGARLLIFNSISAFFACSTAGFLNAMFMRQTELKKGIDLYHPKDSNIVVGKSKLAAKRAVFETAFSRYALCIPIFLPSLFQYIFERMRIMPKHFFAVAAI